MSEDCLISRQAAIKAFQNKYLNDKCGIINATVILESVPSVSDDCVSRQAVETLVDELARAISDERCGILRGRSTAIIMRNIRHLSSVTLKPIITDTDTLLTPVTTVNTFKKTYCDSCGAPLKKYLDYCEYCGTMR